jgi:hypothetical protein
VRVIYVPDCGVWGTGGVESGIEFLIEAIALAFPNDDEIINKCEMIATQHEIETFLKVFILFYLLLFI